MKLYWSPRSPFARKVMITAHETGQAGDIECVPVKVSPFAPDPTLKAVNPLIKIPTLVLDSGERVYDSSVICEYLDSRHAGPKVFPAEGPERIRALTLQALADGLAELLIFWATLRSRIQGEPLDALNETSRIKLLGTLDLLDAQADGWDRNHMNIGTIATGTALGYGDFRFPDLSWRDSRPRLSAWYDDFNARPSARATAVVG